MSSQFVDIIYYLNYTILIYVIVLMTTYLILSFTSYKKIKRYFRYVAYHDQDKIFELRNHIPMSKMELFKV